MGDCDEEEIREEQKEGAEGMSSVNNMRADNDSLMLILVGCLVPRLLFNSDTHRD